MVWSPPKPDLEELLPEGFVERTAEWGLVVKSWAPQVAVLNHEAVGGFVTHCGWNSVLEAVCAAVPMVAWPLYEEQPFNRVVLVEEKLALNMEATEDGFVYCTAGISGGHINPAVTFGLFLARKDSLLRAVGYIMAQSLGAISGVGLVKAFILRAAASRRWDPSGATRPTDRGTFIHCEQGQSQELLTRWANSKFGLG